MIGFIGAMDEEVQALTDLMDTVEEVNERNLTFWKGTCAGKEIIVTKSGVGKVNAAITTTVLIDSFHPSAIVNIGVAGGLSADQNICDIVVAEKVAHYDIDVLGWPVGFNQDKTCYTCDETMVQIMKEAMKEEKVHHVFFGNIACGDSFVYRPDQVEMILKHYPEALCCEMEGAAIGQVCTFYGTPFLILRSLSDITVLDDSENTADYNLEIAAQESAAWCKQLLMRMA